MKKRFLDIFLVSLAMTLTGCMMNNSASESKDKPIKVEQKNKKIKQIKAKYQVVEHDWNVYK
ncbi:MAG: alpha/beta hydrolase, partial [Lactobacillus acidophilus]